MFESCVASNRYGSYCVPLSSKHRWAAKRILAGGVWEPKTIEFVVAHADGGDIIHAGTYFGDFLPAFSSCCAKGCKVWAFEPNPENFRCAVMTMLINNIRNVELRNAALGESNCWLPLMFKNRKGGSLGGVSRLAPQARRRLQGRFLVVNVVRLDEIVPKDRLVKIIQLDVEGAERAAIAGASRIILRDLPILILETVPGPRWFKSIQKLGYRITGRFHNNTVLRVSNLK